MQESEPELNGWSVRSEPALAGYTVEWAEGAELILSRGERLYRTNDLRPPFERIGAFPLALGLRVAAHLRPPQRALRLSFYNVVRLKEDRLFVTFNKSVGVMSPGGFSIVRGFDRPFRVLRGGCAIEPDGAVWFGEYVRGGDGPLRIYRLAPDTEKADIAHAFPPGFARHIHAVHLDPHDGSLWCVTGDHEDQCKILRSSDSGRSFATVGSGDESWRAISLQFCEDAIYYATDAEFLPNSVYRLERDTLARTRVATLDGPVYYSYACGADLFFAVSAELCPSQVGRNATIWHLDPRGDCTPVVSFAKDALPVRYFQPGTISFPRGPGARDEFFFTGVALRGADGVTFRVRRAPTVPHD